MAVVEQPTAAAYVDEYADVVAADYDTTGLYSVPFVPSVSAAVAVYFAENRSVYIPYSSTDFHLHFSTPIWRSSPMKRRPQRLRRRLSLPG